MTAGVVAVVQVDAGEPAAQGEAEAVPAVDCSAVGSAVNAGRFGTPESGRKTNKKKPAQSGGLSGGYPAAPRGYLLSPTGWSLSSL